MLTNMQHRSEIATAKLVKAFIEERLWHGGNQRECGCAITQMGDGHYDAAKYLGLTKYNPTEARQVEAAFEDYRYDHEMGVTLNEYVENRTPATFDDLDRTVQCLMDLDKEYYERKPIVIGDEIKIMEEV